MVNVLSIQSHVAYGHAGNASAVFPLQRLGIEVWPVHTVQFSNHTGYGAWTGRVFDGQAVDEVVQGIEDRGVLGSCDAVLSGYLGSADIGHAVLGSVAKVRAANPAAVWCCDPVIGDVGRGRVRPPRHPGVPARGRRPGRGHRHAQPLRAAAAGRARHRVAGVGARRRWPPSRRSGPRVVLTTSLVAEDTPEDSVDLLASEGGRHFRVRTPRLDVSVNGAGDAIAALFLAHWLDTRSAGEALGRAAASVFGLLPDDRRGRLPRDPAGRRAGRVRLPHPHLRRHRGLTMSEFPTLAELTAEEDELQLARFTNDDAWALGSALVARGAGRASCRSRSTSRHGHQLFPAAMTGATPDNETWIARKARDRAPLRAQLALRRPAVPRDGDDVRAAVRAGPERYAAHGGGVPLVVRDVGPVGVVVVSGLPQVEDHRMVVTAARAGPAAAGLTSALGRVDRLLEDEGASAASSPPASP